MAGDWLKVELVTVTKPEVVQLASALGVTVDDALGKVIRFWCWCNAVTENGHIHGVTFVTLNSLIGAKSFAENLEKVGWLKATADGFYVPNFNRHNSESAKKRALSALRKARQRSRSERDTKWDKSVTREEKRRYNPPPPKSPSPPRGQGGLEERQSQTRRQQRRDQKAEAERLEREQIRQTRKILGEQP